MNFSREDSDFPVFTILTQPVKFNPVTHESEKTGCMKICSVYEIPVSHQPYTWNKLTSFFFFFFFFFFLIDLNVFFPLFQAENIYNDEDPDTPASELESGASWKFLRK